MLKIRYKFEQNTLRRYSDGTRENVENQIMIYWNVTHVNKEISLFNITLRIILGRHSFVQPL